MNMQNIGKQIEELRRSKNMTQTDLGDRLGVSFQAVSKWERGETLPDTAILVPLAEVLETTVDFILTDGEKALNYKGKIKVCDMIEGIKHLGKMGECLGHDNIIYRHAIKRINDGMNTDIEACFTDDYVLECFVAEAIIQNLKMGAYVDLTDVKKSFKHEHFRNIVIDWCARYDLK